MALDPNIITGIRPVQIDSPVNALAQALRVQGMQQETQMGQAKLDEYQRAKARQNKLTAWAQSLPANTADEQRISGMRNQGWFDEADKLEASMLARQKTDAEVKAKEWETQSKKLDLAGQAFGYVRQNPTLEAAHQVLDYLGQNGVYSPEIVAQYKQAVAADPTKIASLADTAFRTVLGAKEQLMKTDTRNLGGTTQTLGIDPVSGKATVLNTATNSVSPDAVLQAETTRRGQNMADARAREAQNHSDGTGLSDATKMRIAMQFVDAGDTSGLKNIGRGAQGAKDLRGIQNAITDYATSKGLNPTEISAKIADFEGLKAGLRTSANISARVENAISEAKELAPLAIEAGRQVSRSGILAFGRAQVMFDTQTNDPALKAFATANNGLVSAYAGAMARGQKPTVSDYDHAREILAAPQSQAAYEATVKQMYAEMAAASRAPQNVREHLRGQISGKGSGHDAVPATASPGIPDDITALLKKHGGK